MNILIYINFYIYIYVYRYSNSTIANALEHRFLEDEKSCGCHTS